MALVQSNCGRDSFSQAFCCERSVCPANLSTTVQSGEADRRSVLLILKMLVFGRGSAEKYMEISRSHSPSMW